MAGDVSPISSRNRVPPEAVSKRPFLVATAPVKAPLTWPKSSLSSRGLGHAPAVDGHEGFAAPRGALVDGPCHEFLSRPALPLDEDAGGGGGDALDEGVDPPHLGVAAHDLAESLLLAQLDLEEDVLFAQRLLLEGVPDDVDQLVHLEGLGDVVEGAKPDGLDGRIRAGVGGHEDDLGLGIVGLHAAQQVDAGEAGHANVRDDEVEGAQVEGLQGRLAALRDLDLVALLREEHLEHSPHGGFVVDDQDLLAHGRRPTGRESLQRVPLPGVDSMRMEPPCCSAMR